MFQARKSPFNYNKLSTGINLLCFRLKRKHPGIYTERVLYYVASIQDDSKMFIEETYLKHSIKNSLVFRVNTFGVTSISQGAFGAWKIFADFSGYLQLSAMIWRVLFSVAISKTTITCKIYRQFARFHWVSWFESLTLLFGCFQQDKYQIRFLARRLGTAVRVFHFLLPEFLKFIRS